MAASPLSQRSLHLIPSLTAPHPHCRPHRIATRSSSTCHRHRNRGRSKHNLFSFRPAHLHLCRTAAASVHLCL
eukprot:9090538-Ditylum_brightwellii.AAC.1